MVSKRQKAFRNFISVDFGGCDWCQISLASDRGHLLIHFSYHVICPHEDIADGEDQEDQENQETRVLFLHDAGFFQQIKPIASADYNQGNAVDNTFSGSGQKFFTKSQPQNPKWEPSDL
jgi:hypothetical protein